MPFKQPEPLTRQQKTKYLELLYEGLDPVQILYSLSISKRQHFNAKKEDKVFARAIKKIERDRPAQVENALFRYATGRSKIVKTTMRAQFDEDTAEILRDKQGNILWEPVRQEVTEVPANPSLIQYYLNRNSDKKDETILAPDALVRELERLSEEGCA
jgi:hypothetical protein